MACKIVYKNNKPVGVEENNDLFQQILSNPQVKDFNEALEIFQQTYSDELKDAFKEPIFSVEQAIQRNNGNPLNLAPNVKPSILYQSYKDLGYSDSEAERLVAQTFSDSFLDFFGDWLNNPQNASKVVDSNGQPLVVYHGTDNTFTEFTNSYNQRMKGFYFSNDLDNSKTYGENILSVFQNIKNPFILDAKNQSFTDDIEVEVVATYPNEKPYDTKINLPIDDIVDLIKNGKKANSFIDIKNRESYDGVIFKNIIDPALSSRRTIPQDTSVVFEPNQIKSATENVGTFSTESNDIRYSIIGEKGARNLDQIEEATFRMDNLATARLMEKAGKTPLEIKRATGWERGAGKIDSFDRLNEAEAIDELLSKNIIEEVNC